MAQGFSQIFSGASATAGTGLGASGLGGTGASSLPTAAAAPSIWDKVFSKSNLMRGLGAGAEVFGALSQRDDLRAQSRFSNIQAERERIRGIEVGNAIKRDFVDNLARNTALIAGSGLQGVGSFQAVQQALVDDAERELNIARDDSFFRSETKRLEASTLKSRSNQQIPKAIAKIATSLISV